MARIVNDNKLRAVMDGELFTASTAAELVHLLNVTTRFREGAEPSDADFTRDAAERARTLHGAGLEGGGIVRYDTPENFIWDLRDAGLLELLKREIVP
jgi:hypothetical protein